MNKFPEVIGKDLNGNKVRIPDELKGELNLLLVAFQQWQQKLVNTWVPFLDELTEKCSFINYYELPTLKKYNFLYRQIIDGGMRAGIPSNETRARTITLYLDKAVFNTSLGIQSEDTIYIFLVDKQGQILWQGEAEYTIEKGQLIMKKVECHITE